MVQSYIVVIIVYNCCYYCLLLLLLLFIIVVYSCFIIVVISHSQSEMAATLALDMNGGGNGLNGGVASNETGRKLSVSQQGSNISLLGGMTNRNIWMVLCHYLFCWLL